MADLVEDLVPEIVSNEMYLVQETGGNNKTPSKFVYYYYQNSSHKCFALNSSSNCQRLRKIKNIAVT
jgi:hypothetical protein